MEVLTLTTVSSIIDCCIKYIHEESNTNYNLISMSWRATREPLRLHGERVELRAGLLDGPHASADGERAHRQHSLLERLLASCQLGEAEGGREGPPARERSLVLPANAQFARHMIPRKFLHLLVVYTLHPRMHLRCRRGCIVGIAQASSGWSRHGLLGRR